MTKQPPAKSSNFSHYTIEADEDTLIFEREGEHLHMRHIETVSRNKLGRLFKNIISTGLMFVIFNYLAASESQGNLLNFSITGSLIMYLPLVYYFLSQYRNERPYAIDWVKGGALRGKRRNRRFNSPYRRAVIILDLKLNNKLTSCEMHAYFLFDASQKPKPKWKYRTLFPTIHWQSINQARLAASGLSRFMRRELKVPLIIHEWKED